MFRNADEKYKAITKFLADCGIEADMYPQGSFAFGTVVRPNAKDPAASYDLDFICQVKGNRNDHTPSELRNRIEEALTSSKVYGGKLEVYKECFTIEYADINGVGFTIDIVPATDEASENKSRLTQKSLVPQLIGTAIAVPKHNGERNYSWLTNNPKGFKAWFDQINEPFLSFSRTAYRQNLFEQNTALFASVEEIPHELEKALMELELGLEERLDSKVGLLSGGQRQALTLLMATLVTPDLLLLDEHTAALDPKTALKVLELSQKIVEEHQITTLMITHNMEDALKYGNKTMIMKDGQIIAMIEGKEREEMTVEGLIHLYSTSSQEYTDRVLLK